MTETLDLVIDSDQYARIQQAEAVVVTHYTGPHGRFTKLAHIGTLADCEVFANTPSLLIVPLGVTCDGRVVVPTSELFPPRVAENGKVTG